MVRCHGNSLSTETQQVFCFSALRHGASQGTANAFLPERATAEKAALYGHRPLARWWANFPEKLVGYGLKGSFCSLVSNCFSSCHGELSL